MIVFPNAKINLGLNITSRREDGYHNISSCFVPIGWRDALEIIPAKEFSFQSSGLKIPGDPGSNLCVKAYHILQEEFDIPEVSMHLHKVIPMGAGLGGGSSDGAFALMLLNDLFELKIPQNALEDYAKQLGADCPFFIRNKPMLVSGIGEIFEETALELSGIHIIVAYPNIHVNTGLAFKAITPSEPEIGIAKLLIDQSRWKESLINDFEEPAIAQHIQIQEIKDLFYESGAFYASMTGSGSSVYGLFKSAPKLDWKELLVWQGEL